MIFFLYARPSFKQKYSLYIGKVTQSEAFGSVEAGHVDANGDPYIFHPGGDWIRDKSYSTETGLLEFTIDLGGQESLSEKDRPNFCQPKSYCTAKGDDCVCAAGSSCKDDSVCRLGIKDIECPTTGCYGLQITLPSTFKAESQPALPPSPVRFSELASHGDMYFNEVRFHPVDKQVAGDCHYVDPPARAPGSRPAFGTANPEQ